MEQNLNMAFENFKQSFKKVKNATLENYLCQLLDKMESQEKVIVHL